MTPNLISSIIPRVGRRRINDEQTPARFPAGTLARIDTVLAEKEKRADLIRDAVEREIKRRQQKAPASRKETSRQARRLSKGTLEQRGSWPHRAD